MHTYTKRKRWGEVNLYMVLDSNYDWCCFAFENALPEEIADHFLANGVIVPPCKVGGYN